MAEVEEQQEEKKFRLNAKKVFLTYADCEEKKEDLLAHLKTFGLLVRYVVAREKHEQTDEDKQADLQRHHLHAVLEYASKLDVKNPKFFDWKGFHPNIQKCRSYENSATYAMKDGDFLTATTLNTADPNNYRKRKADFQEWTNDNEAKALTEVKWPIVLLNGSTFNPTGMGKRRHLWIVGEPNLGKTTWIQNTFVGTKTYVRAKTIYPYEQYRGEKVVICDDFKPDFEEIAAVCNRYRIKTQVYGNVRYTVNYWALNTDVTMIVLHNNEPDYGSQQAAFLTRFNVIKITAADVPAEFAYLDEPDFPLPDPEPEAKEEEPQVVHGDAYPVRGRHEGKEIADPEREDCEEYYLNTDDEEEAEELRIATIARKHTVDLTLAPESEEDDDVRVTNAIHNLARARDQIYSSTKKSKRVVKKKSTVSKR